MKNKKIVFYTIYKESNNDLQAINQFDTLQEIADFLQVKKSVLKVMISKGQSIKNQYKIIKDYILTNELESI